MKKIRVFVVDDQAIIREGIVAILGYYSDIEVVGEAGNGEDALKLVEQRAPDVVLFDLMSKDRAGLATIPLLRKVIPHAKILVVTGCYDRDLVFKAIKAGALGYLFKDINHSQLLEAIRNVSKGQPSLHPSIAMMLIQEISHGEEAPVDTAALTPRESETLQLIARGLSNQEIADLMVVHERTVAKYVSSILTKLNLANRTQAALYALQLVMPEKKPVKPASRKKMISFATN